MRLNLFFSFIFSFISFYSLSQIKYEPKLPTIHECNENFSFDQSVFDIFFPDNVINIGLLKEKIKASSKIDFIPLQINNNLKEIETGHYFYGTKKVFDLRLILYSNEYLPWKLNDSKIYTTTDAYILVVDNNSTVKGVIKTFDDYYLSEEEYLKSYFCDNYIIVVKSYDNSYDVNIQGKDSEIKYTYAVVKLTKNGNLIVLPEKEGKKIGLHCLSQYDEFKGKL